MTQPAHDNTSKVPEFKSEEAEKREARIEAAIGIVVVLIILTAIESQTQILAKFLYYNVFGPMTQ